MKIALVHDDFIQWGGAERMVKTFADIWPNAEVFTTHHAQLKGSLQWLSGKKLQTSFLQSLPFHSQMYRGYFMIYPMAVESWDFQRFDVVLSSSARFAHGLISLPNTLHISYVNSPPRMNWDEYSYFSNSVTRGLASPFSHFLRQWDVVAGQRADVIIANSKHISHQIQKRYQRKVDAVIPPFVDLNKFITIEGGESTTESFFLVVSRLVPWKRIDVVIRACNVLQLPLIIIGEGSDYSRLKRLLGSTVKLRRGLTDEEVARYYRRCTALIHPQEEDFGITILEAMACGKPVLAYGAGGALEKITGGVTGDFFFEQTEDALVACLRRFNPDIYDSAACQATAALYDEKQFKKNIRSFVEEHYLCHINSKRDF
jgi:glycosyltransferase involved in cell wall biosynthesis